MQRTLLPQQLERAGYAVEVAGDGDTALRMLAAERRSAWPYAGVLTDVHMRPLDGFALLRAIRSSGRLYHAFPVIAVTPRIADIGAHAAAASRISSTGDYEELGLRTLLADGFNDVLCRPYRSEQLLRTVARHVPLVAPAAEDEAPPQPVHAAPHVMLPQPMPSLLESDLPPAPAIPARAAAVAAAAAPAHSLPPAAALAPAPTATAAAAAASGSGSGNSSGHAGGPAGDASGQANNAS